MTKDLTHIENEDIIDHEYIFCYMPYHILQSYTQHYNLTSIFNIAHKDIYKYRSKNKLEIENEYHLRLR